MDSALEFPIRAAGRKLIRTTISIIEGVTPIADLHEWMRGCRSEEQDRLYESLRVVREALRAAVVARVAAQRGPPPVDASAGPRSRLWWPDPHDEDCEWELLNGEIRLWLRNALQMPGESMPPTRERVALWSHMLSPFVAPLEASPR